MKNEKLRKITISFIGMILLASNLYSVENTEKPLPKVLILDFANINNSPDYHYLETSIPESFAASFSKLKKFQIMDRNIWANEVAKGNYSKKNVFDQKTALKIANKYNVDLVLIGSFAASGDQMQIFSKVIEVSTDKILVNDKTESALDGNMFLTISKLTDEMAAEMENKLPQLNRMTDLNNRFAIFPLITRDLFENKDLILDLSKHLTADEKAVIFNEKKKDAVLPFTLNLLIGLGIGSFVQGDIIGGVIPLVGEIGSIGLFTTGLLILPNSNSAGGLSILGGIVGYSGFRVFEVIRPWGYANLYNNALGEALRLSFVINPYINLAQNGNPVYGLSMTVKF